MSEKRDVPKPKDVAVDNETLRKTCAAVFGFALMGTVVSAAMVLFNYVSHRPKMMWIWIGAVSLTCVLVLGYEIFVNHSSPIYFSWPGALDGH